MSTDRSPSNCRILIVDDDQVFLALMQDFLQDTGHRVDFAARVAEQEAADCRVAADHVGVECVYPTQRRGAGTDRLVEPGLPGSGGAALLVRLFRSGNRRVVKADC